MNLPQVPPALLLSSAHAEVAKNLFLLRETAVAAKAGLEQGIWMVNNLELPSPQG